MLSRLKEVSTITWGVVGGIMTLFGVVGGWIFFWGLLTANFAPIAIAEEVRLNAIRLEQKIIHDNITFTIREMRQLKTTCKTTDPLKMDPYARQYWYKLETDLNTYNRQLNDLNKKIK